MRRLALTVVLLCGCPEEKKEKPPEPHAATPVVVDAGPVITKNVVPLAQPPPQAEVELTGTVDLGKVKATRLVFVVTKSSCDATELDIIEQQDVNAGPLFTEMFFEQHTQANLCLIALDKAGKQVGFAAYAKNPVTFEGEGEVEVKDLELKVSSVKARAAPKGM